jgi:hypothetical protein
MIKLAVTMDDPEVERALLLLEKEGLGKDVHDRAFILVRATEWLNRASLGSYPIPVSGAMPSVEFAVSGPSDHGVADASRVLGKRRIESGPNRGPSGGRSSRQSPSTRRSS